MKYLGSKTKLLDFIEDKIETVIKDNNEEGTDLTFFDMFAGTGSVAKHFKEKGYKVYANDLQYYSYVMNKKLISLNKKPLFKGLEEDIEGLSKETNLDTRRDIVFNYLENLEGIKGFMYNNYCVGGTKDLEKPRLYFTDENASLCDAIRIKIEDWYKLKKINEEEYYFLISSLITSIDKRANTTSVYAAYLKEIKGPAKKRLNLFEYGSIYDNGKENPVFNRDSNELIKEVSGDILYLDIPYNRRQYHSNYHILETIAKYDNPKIKGITGVRAEEDKVSNYSLKTKARQELEDLIVNANFKYIFLSYSDEGHISLKEIEDIFKAKGDYKVYKKKYRRYKSNNKKQKREYVYEYLHCCIVK